MNYQEHIAALLRQLSDSGLTNQQIADRLGFANGNVISMHMTAPQNISPYPIKRLPALVEACGVDARTALKLVAKRARFHPDNPTQFDHPTMVWQVRITVAAFEFHRRRRGGSAGDAHV